MVPYRDVFPDGTIEYPSNELALTLGARFGVPVWSLKFKFTKEVTEVYTSRTLRKAYSAVYDLYPYDPELQKKMVFSIGFTYQKSTRSFRQLLLKTDYELVILSGYKELARIQEKAESDYLDKVPYFWFDPLEERPEERLTEGPEGLRTLMDRLAIEDSWSETKSNIRYVKRCGFPAGTFFLKTSVEKQNKTCGGATEYIYVDGAKGRVFEVSSQTAKLEE